MAWNDSDDRAGLRGYVQFNKYIQRERERERDRQTDRDKLTPQYEWHRMTRTTAPDCAVVCNLINTHRHTDTQTHTDTDRHTAQVRIVQVERVRPLCRAWSEVFVTSIIDPPLGGTMRVALID